jgi:hypothetical protein
LDCALTQTTLGNSTLWMEFAHAMLAALVGGELLIRGIGV